MSRSGGAYNRVLNCGSPIPNEEVYKVFEPKRVDSLLYTMIGLLNHGTQGTATGSQLSLSLHVPRVLQLNILEEQYSTQCVYILNEECHNYYVCIFLGYNG